MEKIFVTKAFLPPREDYEDYLNKIWVSGQLSNQGPILVDFESRVKNYLKIKNFQFVSNGTIALQLSLEALDIHEGEIITTPFTYVATTSAILWQRCKPVYVDIDSNTLNIDPARIEAAITSKTKAILAVHVFGNPCDIDSIDKIAQKHNLKVIYDAAHGFGVKYKNKSLLDYGDVSTCSFHVTKLFHTIEGGAVIYRDEDFGKKIDLMKRFGHNGDDHHTLGINAKATEFQAAMGLCNLRYIDGNIKERKRVSLAYDRLLRNKFSNPVISTSTDYNYSYYPIIFESENKLLQKMNALEKLNIFPRRYFYPSLTKLPYIQDSKICSVAEDISSRILCLPLYPGLNTVDIERICEVLNA